MLPIDFFILNTVQCAHAFPSLPPFRESVYSIHHCIFAFFPVHLLFLITRFQFILFYPVLASCLYLMPPPRVPPPLTYTVRKSITELSVAKFSP